MQEFRFDERTRGPEGSLRSNPICPARPSDPPGRKSARDEPQLIFNRDRLVAAVVDAESWQAFQAWQERQRRVSLAEAFDELQGIAAEENYELEVPKRLGRANDFPNILR